MINNTGGIELSEAHIAAVNRRRGVIINFAAPSHFDGIWPSWGRGRTPAYPGTALPPYDRDKCRQ